MGFVLVGGAVLPQSIGGLASLAMSLLLAVGCAIGSPGDGGRREMNPIDELLKGLSLEEKAGQLVFAHVYGSDAHRPRRPQRQANERLYGVGSPQEIVETLQPGGIVYIERNPQDPAAADVPTRNLVELTQVAELSAGLQSASTTGLVIATDQEQGPVRRLPSPASMLPGGRELGRTGDTDRASDIARTTGRELLAAGINLNLAPVADVNTVDENPAIGDRSFGGSPGEVADMVAAQIRGYQEAGVAATAKHFPGHGGARVDSHLELPVVDVSAEEWRRVHLPPFVAAIAADVDAIMTAHLAAPALGGDRPATLDPDIVARLLRDELGFDGLVLTDSLWMRGVRGEAGDTEIALRALEAGCDVLLMPPDARGTIRGIVDAVRGGRISQDRLDTSVRRVLMLKSRLGIIPGDAAR